MKPVQPSELPALARTAHEASGLTQRAAAVEMGVSQPVYAKAIGGAVGYDTLRLRIINTWGTVRVSGPVYLVTEA